MESLGELSAPCWQSSSGGISKDLSERQARKARVRSSAEAVRAGLLICQPFLGQLIMHLDLIPIIDVRLDTAATDGQSIFIDCEFWEGLTDQERIFILAHETWHCALLHFDRRVGRDDRCWALAIDHEVNALLIGDAFPAPDSAVFFQEWRMMSAEMVYSLLLARPILVRFIGRWGQHLPISDVDGEWDPDFRPEEGTSDRLSSWPRRVLDAAKRYRPGTEPAWLRRVVERYLPAEMPWHETLRRFITTHMGSGERDWMHPSRRAMARGLWLPGRRSTSLNLIVLLDTSASTRPLIPQFLGEIAAICRVASRWSVRLIQGDAAVTRIDEYDQDHPFPTTGMIIQGGGGTRFRPLLEAALAIEVPPDACVFLTDGKCNDSGDLLTLPWPTLSCH